MQRLIEKDRMMRFFRRYTWSMVFLMVILLISSFLLVARSRDSHELDETRQLTTIFKERVNHFDNLLSRISNRVVGMKIAANAYYFESLYNDIVIPPLIAGYLKDSPDGSYFHLDTLRPSVTHEKVGNLTGKGSIQHRNETFFHEIYMALHLNNHFRANAIELRGIVRFYYISAKSFANIYPWMPSSQIRFSETFYSQEFYKMGLPENNPEKNLYWTSVYSDKIGKDLTTTCAVPIYDRNSFIGIIAMDLTVDYFNSFMKNIQPEQGVMLVVNDRGQLLAHPTKISSEDKTIHFFQDALPEDLVSYADEIKNIELDKAVEFGAYSFIKTQLTHAPWQIFYYIERPAFTSYFGKILDPEAALSFLGFVILILVIFINTFRNFILPSQKLVNFIVDLNHHTPTTSIDNLPKEWNAWFVAIREIFLKKEELTKKVQKQAAGLEIAVENRTAELRTQIVEREKIEEALRQQSNLLKELINSIPDSIFYKDLEGRYLGCNAQFEKIVIRNFDDVVGHTDHELFSKEIADEYYKTDKEILEKGSEIHLESWTKFSDGSSRLMHTIKSLLYDSDKNVIGILGVSRDITERKYNEEEFKKAKVEAEKARQATSDFLTNMSHELRTPLNAVIGCSELLSTTTTDSKQKNYINTIKSAGNNLLSLIDDIMDLSKVEAGKIEIQLSPVNPNLIFNDIHQILSMKATEKGLQCIMEIDEEIPHTLLLDDTRLKQILINLVGNAIKFTSKGHVKLFATTKASDKSPRKVDLIMTVEDTGMGIPEDELEIIFESFEQQKGQKTSKFGGTGLGLPISKKLAKLMNGDISVTSKIDEGSTFKIVLKDVDVITSDSSPLKEHQLNDLDSVSFEKATVLVVDDVRSNRVLLSEMLLTVNLEAITAEDGKEAVLMAEEYLPDIILMDIMMPVMDGYQAVKKIKQNPKTKKIPVFACTAYLQEKDRPKLQEYGFTGSLLKPMNTHTLLTELSKYLKIKKQFTTTNNEIKESSNFDLIEDITDHDQLIKTLETESQAQWENLKGFGKMSDVVVFGDELVQLGQKHNAISLVAYGEKLSNQAKAFHIPNTMETLKEYSSIVTRLAIKSG